MKAYFRLARPQHWIKNLLVLLPLLCSGQLLLWEKLRSGILAFFAFSLLASSVYCINDIRDRDRDRKNPRKCTRPLASGAISVRNALICCAVLLCLAVLCAFFSARGSVAAWLCLIAYFLLNVGYSLGLKNIPLLDIAILVSGFLLRMLYGGFATEIELSKWLCLTVISLSFYLGLGKRRGEYAVSDDGRRKVLKYYTVQFLEQNMYMCVTLTVVFYALWTVDGLTVARIGGESLIWTVPLVILICMRYGMDIQHESNGDPVEILIHDKVLFLLGLLLAAIVLILLYI